jgi:hypothetical protein
MGLEDCEVCEIVCRGWQTILDSGDRFGGHGVDVVGEGWPAEFTEVGSTAQHSRSPWQG